MTLIERVYPFESGRTPGHDDSRPAQCRLLS